MSYKFSMEKILNLREDKEQTVKEHMGLVQTKLHTEKTQLLNIKEEIDGLKKKTYKGLLEMQSNNLYMENLYEKIQDQNKKIDETKKVLEDVRTELVAAQKDRKIMEKLKEKDFEKYRDRIKKAEQKELDEIAVLKFNALRLNN